MTITLNGSSGIQNVLGSAAAPAESNTTSSNTGMYFPTSTTLGFSTAGTNAVTIDASQNVTMAGTATATKLIPTGTSATGNGMYLPATNSVGISTAGVERVRFDASGNQKLVTAGTNIQNSSGNPILLQSGSVLKVQQFTDAGSATTSTSIVNLNTSGFSYTPVSTNSTLYLTITAYIYNSPAAGYAASTYSFYAIGEYISSVWTQISNAGYLWSSQYSTTYAQSIATSAYMTVTRSNTSLTPRSFDLMGGTTSAGITFAGYNIIFTVMEVAN